MGKYYKLFTLVTSKYDRPSGAARWQSTRQFIVISRVQIQPDANMQKIMLTWRSKLGRFIFGGDLSFKFKTSCPNNP